MRARSAIGLSIAVLLGVVALGAWLLAPDTARERRAVSNAWPLESRDDAQAAAQLPAVEPLAEPEIVAPVDVEGAPAGSVPSAVLTGRVTYRADGAPVAGVTVEVRVQQDGVGARPPFAGPGQPITDADGRYRFNFAQVCTVTRLSAGCGPDTTAARLDANLRLEPGRTATLDLTVGTGAVIAGRVVDTSGRVVPRAEVHGWSLDVYELRSDFRPADRLVTADDAGEFVVGGLGPDFTLMAEAPGFLPVEFLGGTLAEGERVGLAAGGAPVDPPLTLVLSPAREIRGRVLGSDGAPYAGAHISAGPQDEGLLRGTAVPDVARRTMWSLERRSAADGTFHMTAASVPYDIGVSARGCTGWYGVHALGDPDLLVRLGAGLVVTGTVVDAASGAPLEGAEVGCYAHSGAGSSGGTTHTDAQGRFEFRGMLAGDGCELDVSAEGHAVEVRYPLTLDAATVLDLRIALEPELVLAGRVVDARGQPVSGADVHVEGDRALSFPNVRIHPVPTWESRLGDDDTTSDDGGRFRVGRLYAGTFRVTATHPLGQPRATLTVPSGSEELLLVLDPGATSGVTLVGRALDDETGLPVTSFTMGAMAPTASGMVGEQHEFEDPDGAFRVTGLPPGPLGPFARAHGYADWTAPTAEFVAGEHRIDIRFAGLRNVTVRTLDHDGQPAQCNLTIHDELGQLVQMRDSAQVSIVSTSTDEDGEVLLRGLPAQRLVITARPFSEQPAQDFPVDLRARRTEPLVLQLAVPSTERLSVLALGCATGRGLPVGLDAERLKTEFQARLQTSEIFSLDADVTLRVLDAQGAELARAVARPASAATLVVPPGSPAASLHPLVGDLHVPIGRAATLEVTADGYRTVRQPLASATAVKGQREMLVLLERE